jgi:hypothetical protein
MNRLSTLLLFYLLSVGSANAAKVEPNDVSFDPNGASNYLFDIGNNEINQTSLSKFSQASEFTSGTDAVPPTLWIVGLGVCMVFLGYKMKAKRNGIKEE